MTFDFIQSFQLHDRNIKIVEEAVLQMQIANWMDY